jgi:hypothetical protein
MKSQVHPHSTHGARRVRLNAESALSLLLLLLVLVLLLLLLLLLPQYLESSFLMISLARALSPVCWTRAASV